MKRLRIEWTDEAWFDEIKDRWAASEYSEHFDGAHDQILCYPAGGPWVLIEIRIVDFETEKERIHAKRITHREAEDWFTRFVAPNGGPMPQHLLKPLTAVIDEDARPPEAEYGPVKLFGQDRYPVVFDREKPMLGRRAYEAIFCVVESGRNGISCRDLDRKLGATDTRKYLTRLIKSDSDWGRVFQTPNRRPGIFRIRTTYR